MKRLGFGMMRLPMPDPKVQGVVDREAVCGMVDAFLERGFTYFDTAYMYHDGQSERIIRDCLVGSHPRESFTLTDKLPLMLLKDKTAEDQARIFAEQYEKAGVDYFDWYFLHNLNADSYETAKRLDSFRFLRERQAEGKFRRLGFSFHDKAEVLDRILTDHPEVELVQLQINYLDWEDGGVQSRLCYETAVKHGKPVAVMEPVKGGRLAKLPEEAAKVLAEVHPDWTPARWAIRFAAGLEHVMVVLSGMSTMEQLEENTGMMENPEPLEQAELDALARAAEIIAAIPAIACTGCRYCVEGCPQGIPIPEYFSLYNAEQLGLRQSGASTQRERYRALAESAAPAGECLVCRKCEDACPQHLPITDWLRRTARELE